MKAMGQSKGKMKIEIWSDIMCSYCYTAKRNFDTALSSFEGASNVEVVWKSFQIAPNIKTEPGKSFYQSLSENTGMTIGQAKSACEQLSESVKEIGLDFNFDIAVPANTFTAHRFSHLAKERGVQSDAEEKLFKAYFTEGKNIDSISVLAQIGGDLGLDRAEVESILESNQHRDAVQSDINQAKQVAVQSVPFYTFNGKQTVSGAQHHNIFLQAIKEAYSDFVQDNGNNTEIVNGTSCTMDGKCL
jgi:predicted DsbA family dithiol-disulfide isomerase